MRSCTKCLVEKDEGAFSRRANGRLLSQCKPCNVERMRVWAKANPERMRAHGRAYARTHLDQIVAWTKANPDKRKRACKKYSDANKPSAREGHLRRKYNLSSADYEAILASQGGRCANAGCRTDKPGGRSPYLHVDHDHTTGKVRALLCNGCNTGLGGFGDSIERLQGAINYLLAHKPANNNASFEAGISEGLL